MSRHALAHGRGGGNRHHHATNVAAAPGRKSHAEGSKLQVQSKHFVDPHFPFQPLPTPNGEPPFRFDLKTRKVTP